MTSCAFSMYIELRVLSEMEFGTSIFLENCLVRKMERNDAGILVFAL